MAHHPSPIVHCAMVHCLLVIHQSPILLRRPPILLRSPSPTDHTSPSFVHRPSTTPHLSPRTFHHPSPIAHCPSPILLRSLSPIDHLSSLTNDRPSAITHRLTDHSSSSIAHCHIVHRLIVIHQSPILLRRPPILLRSPPPIDHPSSLTNDFPPPIAYRPSTTTHPALLAITHRPPLISHQRRLICHYPSPDRPPLTGLRPPPIDNLSSLTDEFPSSIAHRPSPIAHRPPHTAHREQPTAHRPPVTTHPASISTNRLPPIARVREGVEESLLISERSGRRLNGDRSGSDEGFNAGGATKGSTYPSNQEATKRPLLSVVARSHPPPPIHLRSTPTDQFSTTTNHRPPLMPHRPPLMIHCPSPDLPPLILLRPSLTNQPSSLTDHHSSSTTHHPTVHHSFSFAHRPPSILLVSPPVVHRRPTTTHRPWHQSREISLPNHHRIRWSGPHNPCVELRRGFRPRVARKAHSKYDSLRPHPASRQHRGSRPMKPHSFRLRRWIYRTVEPAAPVELLPGAAPSAKRRKMNTAVDIPSRGALNMIDAHTSPNIIFPQLCA